MCADCCRPRSATVNEADPSEVLLPPGPAPGPDTPAAWFAEMVPRALAYAREQQGQGRAIVGILCEYTPREIIMAAGGVPVCLCGGSAETIPAAEDELPANLCPMIKSTYGYSVKQSNPFLEMADLVVAETTCDGKKKMYERMALRHAMYVLELPQKPDDPDAFEHWVREIHKLKGVLEARFGTKITDDRLRAAIRVMNRERKLRREVAALMKRDVPPFSGSALLDMKSLISGIPSDLAMYERVLAEADADPVPSAIGSREAPVRVLVTGVPLPHGAERIMGLIEQAGGLVVCQENCTGLKPILEDVDEDAEDLVRAIAEKYIHLPCSVMTPNTARLDLLRRLAREYRVDCVVEVIWQACLTYDVESVAVRHLVREELDLPYLRIETDYSPSDSGRLSLRLQALMETARGRKAAVR